MTQVSDQSENASAQRDGPRWGQRNTMAVSIASGLSFEKIGYRLQEQDILKDISFRIEPGETVCLLGPSGSGKTSLLRIAAGIERQTSGRVLLDGRELAGEKAFVPPERRGIGLVFQDYALFPHLTIVQNVKFGLTNLKSRDRDVHARRLLERVGLGQLANAYPQHLSGGEKQRVALARALAPRPGVLLLDEPFSGLDSRLRELVRHETITVLRETRATAIFVTHDAEEALAIADRIALLKNGHLVQFGAAKDLFHRPNCLFSAEFFSPLNIFSGPVTNGAVETPLGRIPAGSVKNNQRAIACVRYSALRLSHDQSKGVASQITDLRFAGDQETATFVVENSEERLFGCFPAGTLRELRIDPHQSVYLTATMSGTFVFPGT